MEKFRNPKICGLVTLLVTIGLLCWCLLYEPRKDAVKADSVKLPFPAGTISLSPNSHGELAYLTSAYSGTQKSDFPFDLFLQRIGPDVKSPEVIHKHRFLFDGLYNVVGCDFSPDGKHILLKISYAGVPTDVYKMLVWSPEIQHLDAGPNGLRYVQMCWSPRSDHIAYLRGGDANGIEVLEQGDENQDAPVTLYVYNTSGGTDQAVAQHPMLHGITWMSPDILLYSVAAKPLPFLFATPNLSQAPSIYSYSLSTRASTKLIENGFNPASSPDGKQVAFIGWPGKSQNTSPGEQARTSASALYGVCVYDIEKQKILQVYSLSSTTERDQLLWTPDNKHLLLLRVLYRDTRPSRIDTDHPINYPGYGEGHFVLIDPQSKTSKEIAVVKTVDAQARLDPATVFQFKGFSKTGQSLFFYTEEVTAAMNEDKTGLGSYDSLRSLDLNDGSIQAIYTGTNLSSVGWHP